MIIGCVKFAGVYGDRIPDALGEVFEKVFSNMTYCCQFIFCILAIKKEWAYE